MKKELAKFILKFLGWKTVVKGDNIDKCVLCVAPHTSNWDFVYGKLAYMAIGRSANFLIKDNWFFFPFNHLFSAMGGVPVDRSRRTSLTDKMAAEFNKRDYFQLAITPEGTRKLNPDWKHGFYHIALKANVPIMLMFIDYKTKEAGVLELFYPTGDEVADMKTIKRHYKNVTARKPELFSVGTID